MKRMDAGMSRIGAALLSAVCITHFSLRADDNPPPVLSVDWSANQTIVLGWSNVPPGFVLESVGSLPPLEPWQGIPQVLSQPRWGLAADFGHSTLDTALVLRALNAARQAGGIYAVCEAMEDSL